MKKADGPQASQLKASLEIINTLIGNPDQWFEVTDDYTNFNGARVSLQSAVARYFTPFTIRQSGEHIFVCWETDKKKLIWMEEQ